MSPTLPRWEDRRELLQQLLAASLRLADPAPLVLSHLSRSGSELQIDGRTFSLSGDGKAVVLSLGKAAARLAEAVSSALGPAVREGLIVAPGFSRAVPPGFQEMRGGHPLPDEGSLSAGRVLEQLVSGLASEDLFLALVSGGGSACLESSIPGIGLGTLREINRTLILSGAAIEEINMIRSALSRLKRGRLARMALPAQTIGLILSDVVGDRLELVASGPTVEAPLHREDVRRVARQYQIERLLPVSLEETMAAASALPTMRPEPFNVIIGDNAGLARSVARSAREMGFEARVVATDILGEARTAGLRIASILRSARSTAFRNPQALVFGGETTVHVHGLGQGGRNQELALSAASALQGIERTALVAFGTDGVDGNSEAAGAFIDGDTCQRANGLGIPWERALEQNDSHTFFHRLGDCVHTGPTGTNLNDLIIALVFP
jgi:glycerate 2-kinase